MKHILLKFSQLMASKSRLALMTILILIGVTWGLWSAIAKLNAGEAAAGTRGGASSSLCKQATVEFDPMTSVRDMSRMLRAEDAYVLYGPDEFGEYQLRFAANVSVPDAIARLQAQAGVVNVIANPVCP